MNVLLFAPARDLIGADRIEIAASDPDNDRRIAPPLDASAFRMPPGCWRNRRSRSTTNSPTIAAAIPAGAEVALLPPVSGG